MEMITHGNYDWQNCEVVKCSYKSTLDHNIHSFIYVLKVIILFDTKIITFSIISTITLYCLLFYCDKRYRTQFINVTENMVHNQ